MRLQIITEKNNLMPAMEPDVLFLQAAVPEKTPLTMKTLIRTSKQRIKETEQNAA